MILKIIFTNTAKVYYIIPSHYRAEHSSLNYFKDSSLNLSRLYQLFIRFYELKYENKKCPITESTYCKYFNHFVNFTFEMPRTDVCNDCFTYKQTNEQMIDDAVHHYWKVNDYRELKKRNVGYVCCLCCEFDYTGLQGFVVEKLWVVSKVIFDVESESGIRISLSRQDFEIFKVMCSKNGIFRYF